jgi:hypothetical protein
MNHIATAEDFRQLAESEAYEPEKRIVLPKCGLAIIVRRPRPLAYAMAAVQLPQSLAAKIARAKRADGLALSEEEQEAMAERAARVYLAAIVRPKFSFNPGEDEVSPAWLPPEDQEFLRRYIGGEVDELGNGLDAFRSAEESRLADRGASGEAVSGASEPAYGHEAGPDGFPV